jgi:hypothetical protein
MAPGLGLYLDELYFQAYNKKIELEAEKFDRRSGSGVANSVIPNKKAPVDGDKGSSSSSGVDTNTDASANVSNSESGDVDNKDDEEKEPQGVSRQ